jgi:cation:H+ antiporter
MGSELYLVLHLLLIAEAVVLLWKGADWFVDGAVRIARRLQVSDLVIGLTLVGLATSAPEFAVSVRAALSGHSNISAANVVGSNIFNLGFILGGCAAIRPIATSRSLVYRDGVFLVSVTLLLTFFARDLNFGRGEGAFLIGLLVVYLLALFLKKEPLEEVSAADKLATGKDVAIAAVGFVLIILGGELLVSSSIVVARAFGMSEWAIGVTVVAAGTSAPELVTSLNAAVKGRYGISAGNLIGSDLFNLLGVLGLAAFLRPLNIDPAGQTSLLVLIGMVVLVVIFLRSGWRMSRLEGSILVLINVVRWVFDMTHRSS